MKVFLLPGRDWRRRISGSCVFAAFLGVSGLFLPNSAYAVGPGIGAVSALPHTMGTTSAASCGSGPRPNIYHVEVGQDVFTVGGQAVLPHGIGASFTVNQPAVRSGKSWSISQLLIYGDQNNNTWDIEYGWMLATADLDPPGNFGDGRPHIFLAVRSLLAPGHDACGLCFVVQQQNQSWTCGFHPLNAPRPMEAIAPTDQPQRFHIGYFAGNNAWWVEYQGRWIGYIDAGVVYNNVNAQSERWYGEVGSYAGQFPCVQMGNGTYGSQPGSARITGMFFEAMVGGQSRLYPSDARRLASDQPGGLTVWDGNPPDGAVHINSLNYGGPGYAC
jgi:hypothetical protein